MTSTARVNQITRSGVVPGNIVLKTNDANPLVGQIDGETLQQLFLASADELAYFQLVKNRHPVIYYGAVARALEVSKGAGAPIVDMKGDRIRILDIERFKCVLDDAMGKTRLNPTVNIKVVTVEI